MQALVVFEQDDDMFTRIEILLEILRAVREDVGTACSPGPTSTHFVHFIH